ncbi:hypothetical protein Glove_219g178 [Diversispora epigaea]|uniref:Uncharacterized protein n=1 Tax=Diversispora epigaea TaxID=1348612 RepID=A0A397IM11_9GLOM|nr:hypothetical protein Glove_219g178 [Diversispora epigaea]
MKVRNLLGAYAFKRGMVFSTRVCKNIEKGKYSGAMGGPIKVKLTAGDYFTSTVLKLPGCIPIDVRVCFKKLYPRSEKSSLKFFLEESGLDSKADMPHENMWRIYSDAKEHSFVSTAKNMYKVANYYVIDALRCQELMHQ